MKRNRKRDPNSQPERIKNWLLKGEEIDPVKAASPELNFGLNLSTRISKLRRDYGMSISQKPMDENKPNGMQVYWMTAEQRSDYKQSNR